MRRIYPTDHFCQLKSALVYWDINSLAPHGWNIGEWDTFIVAEVNKRVPRPKNSQFKAFSRFPYTLATSKLQTLD